MPLYATAGCKLYIGGVLDQKSADFAEADFAAVVWVQIKSLESMGSLGDTSNGVSIDLIDEGRTKTLKGTRSAGNMEIVCGLDAADAGQIAAIAAEKTPYDYAFKVELNDKPAGGTNGTRLFIAKVMSQAEVYDAANNVRKQNLTLAVNSNVVRIAAAEA
jgi:hypothetical protein